LNLASTSPTIIHAIASNRRRVRALRREWERLQPDVIIAFMTTSAVLALLSARGLPAATIVSERTYPPRMPPGPLWGLLRRWTYPRASRVVMMTREGLDWLAREIPGARGAVIPNPVVYPLPGGSPTVPPGDFIAPGERLLLGVGRMDKGKQFDHVLRAFAAAVQDNRLDDWRLVIAGDGPERDALQALASRLGIAHRFAMPGRVGNMADWYSSADLYVSSSSYEGFPNTLIEAMAHRTTAVSYDCDTGPRDIIRNGEDGLLVPLNDEGALAKAVSSLMVDHARRDAMAERAQEVRERFSEDAIVALWRQNVHACCVAT